MTLFLVVVLALQELVNDDLAGPILLQDLGLDARAIHLRRAHHDLLLAAQHQHVIECDLVTHRARDLLDAKFVATGQTGIMIAGSGIPIDAVISDFISGAAEALSPANDPDHWDIIEGQGFLEQTHSSVFLE